MVQHILILIHILNLHTLMVDSDIDSQSYSGSTNDESILSTSNSSSTGLEFCHINHPSRAVKYYVIDCGYTSRLIMSSGPNDHGQSIPNVRPELNNYDFIPVYIKDFTWGAPDYGTDLWIAAYHNASDANTIKLKRIDKFIKNERLDGVVVFKANEAVARSNDVAIINANIEKIMQLLESIRFCGSCDVGNIYQVRFHNEYCIVHVDCCNISD